MSEQKQRTPGTTTISPEVLTSIIKLTTLKVPGVINITSAPPAVDRLFTKKLAEGVEVEVSDSMVNVAVHIVAKSDQNLRQLGRAVQSSIAQAISESVGMEPGKINVHIENIEYDIVE